MGSVAQLVTQGFSALLVIHGFTGTVSDTRAQWPSL